MQPQSQSASPLSNGGLAPASSSSATACHQPPSSGTPAGIHWQPAPAGAYTAYPPSSSSSSAAAASGGATLGLYPPSGGQVNQIATVPLPFSSTPTDPSLLLAAVLQQQRTAAMLMAPVNSTHSGVVAGGITGPTVSTGNPSSGDGSSSTITLGSGGGTVSATPTNGVYNGVPVSESWLSAKRPSHSSGYPVTEYYQPEGNNPSVLCNGANASLLAGGYIAGVAEQQQAEADMFSSMADSNNPSSMAVASLPPVYSSQFAYPPTGYCPVSLPPSLQQPTAAQLAAAAAVPNIFGSINLYGLPYSTPVNGAGAYIPTPAQFSYQPPVYSTQQPQQQQQAIVGAGTGVVDNQASIAALALNNILSQQSPTPTVAGVQPQQQIVGAPLFTGNPQHMANFAATLATLQQQQSSTDLRQISTPVASAGAVAPQTAFQQNQQQQQQQQALFSALLRAHQSQVQQQLVAAQIAAAMQQVTGGAAYASPPPGTCILDAQFPNGITTMASPYTVGNCYSGVVQLQNPITNVAYINEKGNLLETLPICRDFKAGKCHRNNECRYVHLLDAKGRCTRVPCKYFHVPLFAISAHRSLALNSMLNHGGGTNAATLTGSSTATNTGDTIANTNGGPTTNSSSGICGNNPPPSL